ncbi:MAG: hypothetical protein ACI39H_04890 [Lachnospiraceae bacterium]
MQRKITKLTAVLLALLLILQIPAGNVLAAEVNTPKEEVVYINLDPAGTVKEVNVVNILYAGSDGKIVDYGTYESIRNMTTTDELTDKDGHISGTTDAEKLYYEGTMGKVAIPWDISIHYYLNGNEYDAADVGGKSGKLKISMSIRKDPDCNSSFFDDYALMAVFTLDSEKAKNIEAQGATIANVGSEKQLTYTILPGTEKDIIITADVAGFEMDAIAINGVKMSMDIDFDEGDIRDKINEIMDAAKELDDGAGQLNDGAEELHNGTEELYDGSKELKDAAGELENASGEMKKGTKKLYDGAISLNKGLASLVSKNSQLTGAAWSAYEALCSAAETQLNQQLASYGIEKVSLTPNTYDRVLMDLLEQLDADKIYQQAYSAARDEVTKQVAAQADTLYIGYLQQHESEICKSYVESKADDLYLQVAYEAVMAQLMENQGLTQQQAETYLATQEGKILINSAVAAMTEEQKEAVLTQAQASLTEEQKQQILQGALQTMTEDEKKQIREGYIEQMMSGEEVTAQINEAVKPAGAAAGKITELKGQLDNYGAFYEGLVEYTEGVSMAAQGARELAGGLKSLYRNTGKFEEAVGELDLAVGSLKAGVKELKDGAVKLKDGAGELKDGTEEFTDKTSDMDTQVEEEIDDVLASMTGEDAKTVSFVSEQNSNIRSVQFVIQTESIDIPEAEEAVEESSEPLNFWQKLISLFGF